MRDRENEEQIKKITNELKANSEKYVKQRVNKNYSRLEFEKKLNKNLLKTLFERQLRKIC